MRFVRPLFSILACAALSGCVVGYGSCLLMQPLRHDLSGVVHFRNYPAPDGIDNVSILALDSTAYIYSPAQSTKCLPVNELQMVGLAEFPRDVGENTHVAVRGSLFEATNSRQHTEFLLNVTSIMPFDAKERSQSP